MNAAKAKRTLLSIEIPRDELACRVAEAACAFRRPQGIEPLAALEQLRSVAPEMVVGFYRIADAAVIYIHECINAGRQPS